LRERSVTATLVAARRALLGVACVACLALLRAPAIAQEPLVFGAIGDSGEVTHGLLGVVREMEAYRRDRATFDFVLMLGDNIYSDGVAKVFKVRSAVCSQPECSSTPCSATTTFAAAPSCRLTIRRGT
jgi:hypothetical protein